jgi:hypothetical protein
VLPGALALVILAQVSFGQLVDYHWPLLRFASLRHVLGGLERRPVAPDVVVLGSSRMAAAFSDRPPYAPGVVLDACVPAGDPLAQERVWQALHEAGVRPRVVVVEVGPEFLNWNSFAMPYNARRMMRLHDIPAFLSPGLRAYGVHAGRMAVARLLPVYAYRSDLWEAATVGLRGPLAPRPVVLEPAPAGPLPAVRRVHRPAPPLTEEVRKEIESGSATARTVWLKEYRVFPIHEQALHRLIRAIREAGAEPLLVTPPLTASHRSCHTEQVEAAYRAALERADCRHVDCRAWMEDGWFRDTHHLTQAGSAEFLARFADEVLSPALGAPRLAAH